MIVGGHPADEGKYPWQVRIYSTMDDKVGFLRRLDHRARNGC